MKNYKKFSGSKSIPSLWASSIRRNGCYNSSSFVYLKNKTTVSRSTFSSSSSSSTYFASNKRFYTAQVQQKKEENPMFCFQCQQTKDNTGCVVIGDCGKNPEVAAYQDLLIHQCKTLSLYSTELRKVRKQLNNNNNNNDLLELDRWINESLFSTLTNVNFDAARFNQFLKEGQEYKNKLKSLYESTCKQNNIKPISQNGPMKFDYNPSNIPIKELISSEISKSPDENLIGVIPKIEAFGADINGLHELCIDGLKGMCAYAEHAARLGMEDSNVYEFIQDTLSFLSFGKNNVPDINQLVSRALDIGKYNLKVMSLLEEGHTKKFGDPKPTKVALNPVIGKAILITGHDLNNLNQLLEQTKDTGINVYTHGEMLPAHGYPGLKEKYKHLVGNYGNAWQLQQFEFSVFPGPIVVTTNCIIEPKRSYKDRIFTLNSTGWPGAKHISNDDYSAVIECAQNMQGFTEDDMLDDDKYTMTGFGRHAVLSMADTIVNAVKRGDIKHFFLIGGCDGASSQRSYFRDLALKTPKDSVVLTLACGKYRFNQKFKTFGKIKTKTADNATDVEIPRLLDMGQCNDAFSAIKVAEGLASAFGKDVNSLPLSFAVSWFEQKAVAVLLTLLHLNIKNIYLGPSLPAFVTPNILNLLQQNFNINATGDVDDNLHEMLNKQ